MAADYIDTEKRKKKKPFEIVVLAFAGKGLVFRQKENTTRRRSLKCCLSANITVRALTILSRPVGQPAHVALLIAQSKPQGQTPRKTEFALATITNFFIKEQEIYRGTLLRVQIFTQKPQDLHHGQFYLPTRGHRKYPPKQFVVLCPQQDEGSGTEV